MLFDGRIDIGKCPDRTGDRACGNLIACDAQAREVAVHFGVKPCEGQPHGCGFSVDAVAAADADCVFVLKCALFERRQQAFHVFDQDIGGTYQLNVQASVQDVGGGHALMHETRFFGTDMFGQMGKKGDDIMFGNGFDFVDAGDVEFNVFCFPYGLGILARDHSQIGLRVTGMGFDLVPDAELGLGRPDGNHFGAGIAGDHGRRHLCQNVSADRARLSPGEAKQQGQPPPRASLRHGMHAWTCGPC